MDLEKILPKKGPSMEEVKKYLNKYNNEYINNLSVILFLTTEGNIGFMDSFIIRINILIRL